MDIPQAYIKVSFLQLTLDTASPVHYYNLSCKKNHLILFYKRFHINLKENKA